MNVVLDGRRVRLDDRALLGEGGEGRVYRAGARAVKVFTTAVDAKAAKLRAFPAVLPPRVAGPTMLAFDARGGLVGYAMPALDDTTEVARLAQRRWRAGRIDAGHVLAIFGALVETVTALHRLGIVVGDLNDGNVMLVGPDHAPWLIDADSMQLPGHPCTVAHERTCDPRLYGRDVAGRLSVETDAYALAVLLFASLHYVHPFGGAHPAHPTLLRRAEARCSVLRADVKLPPGVRIDILPDDALAWFEGIFERDRRALPPPELLATRFVRCACGLEHARAACPGCSVHIPVRPPVRAAGKLRATRIVLVPGRIVAATGRTWAWEDDAALRREDGSVVLRRDAPDDAAYFTAPARRVRLAGHATWVAVGRRWSCLVGGTRDTFAVTGGDAGPHGLVHPEGDTLVRARDATRLGSVLEGQTHLRVGAELGFAFYRASGVTVAFVFDPRRGALRQIEGFPALAGRLAGWSAIFDDAHALVTFALEEGGRSVLVAHLVARDGTLVASERSDSVAATPLTRPGLAGRALAGGSVVTATDDGLVQLRPDRARGGFAAVRVFPEARELVAASDELLPGPGGSLYVVSDDEITHLCFHP